MKQTFATLAACLLTATALQAQTFQWAKSAGGPSEDRGIALAVDPAGNIYTAGWFSGTVDFDPGEGTTNLTSAGNWDVFLRKMDPSGKLLWARSFGGPSSDVPYGIAIDAQGYVFTTGNFAGTVDFDPGAGVTNLSSAGGDDVFVQKLDASGNFVWAKRFGGTSNDIGLAIKTDASRNVYTIGYFYGTTDFNPGAGTANLTSSGGSDVFIQKLDPAGDFLWAKRFGGAAEDRGSGIALDDFGNICTTGYYQGTVDFDPGAGTKIVTSAGRQDIFVQKLDASGKFLWAKSFGGTANDESTSISVDLSNNIYITGSFSGTANFNPGAGAINLTSAGSSDIFVQKIDASGMVIWAKRFGSTGEDRGLAVRTDYTGNIYLTGSFEGTVNFDPSGNATLTSVGAQDIFAQKLNPNANLFWARSIGSAEEDRGSAIIVDHRGIVYTTGWFSGTADFDPGKGTSNLTSAGRADSFILQMQ